MQRRFATIATAAVSLVLTVGLAGQQTSQQTSQAASEPARPRAAQPAEQPAVTFRVEVNYVEVDAIVTDERGNIVRDLTRDEFQILEDGKPQQVDLFALVDIPIERVERTVITRPPVEPDVRTNDRPFDGRLFVLVLDDMHTGSLRSGAVVRAAQQFVEQNLGANDMAAVVHVSGRTDSSQDFTSNKRLLNDAIGKFMGRKLPSTTLARQNEYINTRGIADPNARIADPYDQERVYNARTSLETLANVADFMTGIRGRRKAVVFFSEGIDYNLEPFLLGPSGSMANDGYSTVLDAMRRSIGAASRANVVFYTVDPRGLPTLGDEVIELSGAFPDDPAQGIGTDSMYDELRRAQDNLRVLADETGGFAAVNSNDFTGAFDRIIRENSAYYVLGYYPTNDRRDGRFRKIEVRVTRPGLTVRARKGYQAPRGKAPTRATEANAGVSDALREVINSPLPQSGLSMEVQAAPFKGAANKSSVLVAVQVDGKALKFADNQGTYKDTLEVTFQAVDAKAKIQASERQSIDLSLRAQTLKAVQAMGFRALQRLDLAPGRYQVRVAGRSAGSGAVGSVFYDLVVPDFSKEKFSVSGLVLTSGSAALTPTARPDEQLKAILPAPAATQREFPTSDTIALFVEAYDNEVSKPHTVDITTTIQAADGRVVFKHEDTRSSAELQGARGGYGYTTQIPLRDVPPGAHVLRVEARSRLDGNEPPKVRETVIRVFPLTPPPSPAPAAAAPAPVARRVVPVARGAQSGVEEYREVVARSEEEWTALWKSLPARSNQPKVTFANTMIVALFAGGKPAAGYTVEIVDVKLDGETLVVEYAERTPDPGTSVAQVRTTPYVVAGVPMHAGPVRFEKVPAPVR